ncbi:MAG: polysaccharide deacetylase family protein, partial [Bradyrhizobium sp.]
MRNALGLMLANVAIAAVIAGVWFWTTSSPRAEPPQTVAARKAEPLPAPAKPAPKDDIEVTAALSEPAAAPAPAPIQPRSTCANPDALGVSRTVVIDTTGGPGFGFEHFKQLDFLADKEVVLTFDDGPWPDNTP